MKSRKGIGILPLVILTFAVNIGYGQEVTWIQPFSGNMFSRPINPYPPADLPNCPDCECEDFCVKCFWKGVYDRICRSRRECYFAKQLYHTGYTRPVLPPYCEPGYGYFETAWRQPHPPICYDPAVDFRVESEPLVEPAPTAPAPVELDAPSDPIQPAPETTDEPDKTTEAKPAYQNSAAALRLNTLNDWVGDEKPRYEVTFPQNNGPSWQPTSLPRLTTPQ